MKRLVLDLSLPVTLPDHLVHYQIQISHKEKAYKILVVARYYSISCMLHTVEFGNHKTGYIFLQILKSGYAKCMLINKGGYDATIWAERPRHPLVQVTPPPGSTCGRQPKTDRGRCVYKNIQIRVETGQGFEFDIDYSCVKPLNGHNYATWKVQCKMALIKDGPWKIVTGSEGEPEAENDRAKYMLRSCISYNKNNNITKMIET